MGLRNQRVMCAMSYNGWGEECQPRGRDCPAQPCPAARCQVSWWHHGTALLRCPARAMSCGAAGWACRLSSPAPSSGYPPLLSLWDCLTWTEMENAQSPLSGGECFGGSFRERSWGMLLSGNGNAKKLLNERRGRAGRAEQREARGCLELLNSSQPPGQNLRLPQVLHTLCSAPGTAHPIHVLCRASCPYPTQPLHFPGGRVYKYKQIKNVQCLSPETPPSPWCWTTEKWVSPQDPSCWVTYLPVSEFSGLNISTLSAVTSLKRSSMLVVKGSTLPLPSERGWITWNRWISFYFPPHYLNYGKNIQLNVRDVLICITTYINCWEALCRYW